MHVQWGGETRRAWTHIDGEGERTITVLGDKLLPHGPLPLGGYDLVFFVSGEPEALRTARAARFLAATVRELPTLREAGVPLDLLVGSLNDAGERYDGSLEAETVVLTDGENGGTANGVHYSAVPAETVVDTYGAGDSFAAALAFALARGDALPAALALAAAAGSAVIGGGARTPPSSRVTDDRARRLDLARAREGDRRAARRRDRAARAAVSLATGVSTSSPRRAA